MSIPDPVRSRVEAYLRAVDSELPGFVEGLYVVGSAVLDDWRAPESDVDAVVVSSVRPDPAMLEALTRVHQERAQPHFDGVYVTWEDLAADPAGAPAGPFSVDGRFYLSGRGQRDPVTWVTLSRHGRALRGPSPSESLRVWDDGDVLTRWTLDNLERYWERRLDQVAGFFNRYVLLSLSDWETAWTVLGIPRLHYILATGDVTSKTGAGRYAQQTFPERWHRVIREALRIRTGEGPARYRNRLTRRRDVRAFGATVIEDARRLAADRAG